MGMISREQMQAAIDAGGVVLIGGNFYGKGNPLPPEADLAILTGDPAQEAAAADDLDARIAALQAQKAKLDRAKAAAAPPAALPKAEAPAARPEPPKGK